MQLFHETWADALREVIAACGGMKQVAARLWPEKTPDAAQRLLLDCLNDTRPEKLGPDHLRMVLQMGRNVGCSAGINWLLRDLQYEDSREVAKEDKKAMLQRDYIAAVKQLAQLSREIEAVA